MSAPSGPSGSPGPASGVRVWARCTVGLGRRVYHERWLLCGGRGYAREFLRIEKGKLKMLSHAFSTSSLREMIGKLRVLLN